MGRRPLPPAAKRTEGEREVDLIEIAKLYMTGETQQTIADHISKIRPYSLTRVTIHNDLKVLHERWKESQLVDFDTAKAKELAKIDRLENEYWFAWKRSLRMSEEIISEKIQDSQTTQSGTTPGYAREKIKKKEVTTFGDPRYLQGVQWCVDKRCAIFGLDAPKKVDINWRDEAKMAGIDPDQFEDKLVKEFVDAAKQGKTMVIIDDDKDQQKESKDNAPERTEHDDE